MKKKFQSTTKTLEMLPKVFENFDFEEEKVLHRHKCEHIFTKPILAGKGNLWFAPTRLQGVLKCMRQEIQTKMLHYSVNLWGSSRLTFRVKCTMIESWNIGEALEWILKKSNS